jgi:hypothetical protein
LLARKSGQGFAISIVESPLLKTFSNNIYREGKKELV